jgi:hypothetical protein
MEGAHAQIGADLAKRYGVPNEVVNIIASHHHEVEQQSIEAVIATTADAISGSRPGARREALEAYVKRIKALEDMGNSFDGVLQTYAIQAGREVRVIVKPEQVDDLASLQLAKDIAKKIEDNLEYPGMIKVTVVREMLTEMAKQLPSRLPSDTKNTAENIPFLRVLVVPTSHLRDDGYYHGLAASRRRTAQNALIVSTMACLRAPLLRRAVALPAARSITLFSGT